MLIKQNNYKVLKLLANFPFHYLFQSFKQLSTHFLNYKTIKLSNLSNTNLPAACTLTKKIKKNYKRNKKLFKIIKAFTNNQSPHALDND